MEWEITDLTNQTLKWSGNLPMSDISRVILEIISYHRDFATDNMIYYSGLKFVFEDSGNRTKYRLLGKVISKHVDIFSYWLYILTGTRGVTL